MPRAKTEKRRPATPKLKSAGVWYDVLPNRSEQREMKREALQLLLQQTGGKNLWERMWIAAEIRTLEA